MKERTRLPLFERIKDFVEKDPVSLHVPGHKHGQIFHQEGQADFAALLRYDVTELSGLDDLHDPTGPIKEAQNLAAVFFGAKESHFLVGGTTVGNLGMILGTCAPGDIVLVQRNSHKSVLNGIKMANVRPVFLSPDYDEHTGLPVGIAESTVERALEDYPEAKVLILTYPSYYGYAKPIKPLIDLAHERNLLVLVDEAHGAHFSFGPPFPETALTQGADVTVQSAHKTLPAMTMGSYLHLSTNVSDTVAQRIKEQLTVLQSSSPSYPILASLDLARGFLEGLSKKEAYLIMNEIEDVCTALSDVPNLNVIRGNAECTIDPLKVILQVNGATGFAFQEKLEQVGVFPELADTSHVLFIFGLSRLHHKVSLVERIKKAAMALANESSRFSKPVISTLTGPTHSPLLLTYDKMNRYATKRVPFSSAQGKIAAEAVIPYPPGVPLITAGEEITEQMIVQYKRLVRAGARFQDHSQQQDRGILVFELEEQ